MNSEDFAKLVSEVPVGKATPKAKYVHLSAIEGTALLEFIKRILTALKLTDFEWNIAKFSKQEFQFSVLSYPMFDELAYPELHKSVFVDLNEKRHRINDYTNTDNPPILHRKELMVLSDYPLFDEFEIITQEGDSAGLYENSRIIGFKLGWEAAINRAGYELVDGRLFRASAVFSTKDLQFGPQPERLGKLPFSFRYSKYSE